MGRRRWRWQLLVLRSPGGDTSLSMRTWRVQFPLEPLGCVLRKTSVAAPKPTKVSRKGWGRWMTNPGWLGRCFENRWSSKGLEGRHLRLPRNAVAQESGTCERVDGGGCIRPVSRLEAPRFNGAAFSTKEGCRRKSGPQTQWRAKWPGASPVC